MGLKEKGFKFFTSKEKLEHYDKVAKGEKKVKSNSKFSKDEQMAYARGQSDARKESKRIYAYKNATPEQRLEFKQKQAEKKKKIKGKK